MDGPEHYRRAEALLGYQESPANADVDGQGRVVEDYAIVDPDDDIHRNPLMAAQVHATLALAAATATSAPMPNRATKADADAWREVTGS